MWCDDDNIKPYFIEAGRTITYGNLKRQLMDSLEDKAFPDLPEELQKSTYWEFGSVEDHLKYRNAVMQTYKYGNFPVFSGFNHMQYQIRNSKEFAEMLESIIEKNELPELPFLYKAPCFCGFAEKIKKSQKKLKKVLDIYAIIVL